MVQYMGDQNTVGFFYASGTYANPTGTTLQSFGLVQSHGPDETVNISNVRYTGTSDRNVGQFVTTTKDYGGTVSYYPQDFKCLFFALGSTVDTSGTTSTHVISETNSDDGNKNTGANQFVDFSIEDTHSISGAADNWKRRYDGCVVDSWSIAGNEGDILSCDLSYRAQSVTATSGNASTYTAASTRPFVFSDCLFHLPSGTVYNEMVSFTFNVNNNLLTRHYGNGSQVIAQPRPQNRDYSLDITLDEDSARRKTLYETYFQGGSTFNCMLEINAASNSQGFIIMSGCRLSSDSVPTPNEGVVSETITILPQTVTVNSSDVVPKFTAW
jgi:hypothetical protein